MSTEVWTVVSLYEPTGQVLVDWVSAADQWQAFARVCEDRAAEGENLADIELVAAIKGPHQAATPTDAGNAAWAVDYPLD